MVSFSRSTVLDASSGEQVCTGCGYVLKQNLEDTGREWRNFAKEHHKVEYLQVEII
jgi:transcription initiation factor TFIIIB Brf1 subunit/transcription initiation factor TFIIB